MLAAPNHHVKTSVSETRGHDGKDSPRRSLNCPTIDAGKEKNGEPEKGIVIQHPSWIRDTEGTSICAKTGRLSLGTGPRVEEWAERRISDSGGDGDHLVIEQGQ